MVPVRQSRRLLEKCKEKKSLSRFIDIAKPHAVTGLSQLKNGAAKVGCRFQNFLSGNSNIANWELKIKLRK
jgi:hypothetical protein